MNPFRLAATFVVIGSVGVALTAQQPPAPSRGFTGRAVQASHHDISPALRDIPLNPDVAEGAETAAHAPLRIPRAPRGQADFRDPALQTSLPAALLSSPATSFDGVNNRDGVLPPDVNGDVGPNHYVQWVNLSYAVYSKTGTRLLGPLTGSQLFSGFSGAECANSNDGDPIALYDERADRWMLSQFALPNYPSGPFYQCIAVSQTGDPTGKYYRYQFQVSNDKMNDYPKFGVWPTGYFMSVNQFSGGSFVGAGVVAFERDQMLQGLAARMYYVDTNDTTLGGMLPSDLDGTAPPAGTPNFFMQFDDVPSQLQVWRFDVTWGSTVTGAFTHVTNLPVDAFDSDMCNYARNCIPQAGTSRKLDALSDRLMYRLQYRNFGAYEAFVTNHTVDVGGDHAGVRWYELRRTNDTFSVRQQGTWAPDAAHRWMASAAMDSAGNIAVAFNASSATIYPSIRYAARLAGDALNGMGQGEADILVGSGYQTSTYSRWGDYSNLSVDPDGCTFWATLEYSDPSTIFNSAPWRTRIAAFKLPGCGSSTGTPPSAPVLAVPTVGSAGVGLSWTDSGPETGYNIDRCTGPSGCTPATIGTVAADVLTYTDATVASGTTYTYRITATNGFGSASSNTQTISTAGVAAPANLKATSLKGGGIRLNWTDNATNETRFEIQRSPTSSSPLTAGANVTSLTDSGTVARTTYTYQVRACDSTSCSAWSNSASARAR